MVPPNLQSRENRGIPPCSLLISTGPQCESAWGIVINSPTILQNRAAPSSDMIRSGQGVLAVPTYYIGTQTVSANLAGYFNVIFPLYNKKYHQIFITCVWVKKKYWPDLTISHLWCRFLLSGVVPNYSILLIFPAEKQKQYLISTLQNTYLPFLHLSPTSYNSSEKSDTGTGKKKFCLFWI